MKKTCKQALSEAMEKISDAHMLVEYVRSEFDMEWGENANSDLDVALTVGVAQNLGEAMRKLRSLEVKYRSCKLTPNFPIGG